VARAHNVKPFLGTCKGKRRVLMGIPAYTTTRSSYSQSDRNSHPNHSHFHPVRLLDNNVMFIYLYVGLSCQSGHEKTSSMPTSWGRAGKAPTSLPRILLLCAQPDHTLIVNKPRPRHILHQALVPAFSPPPCQPWPEKKENNCRRVPLIDTVVGARGARHPVSPRYRHCLSADEMSRLCLACIIKPVIIPVRRAACTTSGCR